MNRFTIKDIETLTGVKAHTIRIWEKRYGIVVPNRSETNIRYYSDEDLRKLLNIVALTNAGVKISKAVKLSEAEISEVLKSNMSTDSASLQYLHEMVQSVLMYDECKFISLFNERIYSLGFDNTMFQIIYPLLEKVGNLWAHKDICPAQEHFVSSLVRMKLYAEINNQQCEENSKGTVVLFLHQNEVHDIVLLHAYCILKKEGYNVVFLGPSVPTENAIDVCKELQPLAVFTVFIRPISEEEQIKFISTFTKEIPSLTLLMSGRNLAENFIETTEEVSFIKSPQDLTEKLSALQKQKHTGED